MQDSGSLAVFNVTARNQGHHYKGHSGAFVTVRAYCNISCLVAILLFYTIMHQTEPQWNSGGQGYFVTLAKDLISVVCQYFQRASPLKLLGQFHLNFIYSFLARGEKSLHI